MQTITYRVSRLAISDVTMIGLGSFIGLLELAGLAWDSWQAGGFAQAWTQDMLGMSMSAASTLVWFSLAYVSWLMSPKRRGTGFLVLDDRGLTHAEGRFRIRQWGWNEFSTFKPERRWARRHIVFTVPGQARPITLYEASKRDLPEGPLVRIQDIYDTPLDDIAAKLNEYRERVLGGVAETSETQSPELA